MTALKGDSNWGWLLISGAEYKRSAHRGVFRGHNPHERRDTVGFRVARTYRQ
jgi:hypothetical protein